MTQRAGTNEPKMENEKTIKTLSGLNESKLRYPMTLRNLF